MSQGKVQFSPRQRFEVRWPGDEDREDAPVFVFRPLTLDEFVELFEIREICRKPRGFDDYRRLRELTAKSLVGWRNQTAIDTDEPLEFDASSLGRVTNLPGLLLLSSIVLAGGVLSGDDAKKSASPR